MKIEKVNENQIRCTLTKDDLASRELKISELAYGTEKAKSLFRDMMQQANYEFGFEAEDIPLMIEAIPMNAECIVLIITKVEDPEELDTRFSRFAPSVHEDEEYEDDDPLDDDDPEVLDLFRQLDSSADAQTASPSVPQPFSALPASQVPLAAKGERAQPLLRLFFFDSMRPLLTLSAFIGDAFEGESSLYKDAAENRYYLLLTQRDGDAAGFNRICNTISEYGAFRKVLPTTPSYLEEHYEKILPGSALGILSRINREK